MKQGRKPDLEEIAEEALVSRATAYRYFPSVEALLLEASLDVAHARRPTSCSRDAAGRRSGRAAASASTPRCTT